MAIPTQRIVHVNLNVSSLATALPLFTEMLGLRALAHMHAAPQSGLAMGLAGEVQWSGDSIHGPGLWETCMVDLLEWLQPPTLGVAHADPRHIGVSRLALRQPNLDTLYTQLGGAGVRCFAGPITGPVSGERFFCCANADGSVLQMVEHPGPAALHYVSINCRDLAYSSRWYQEVLGFEPESDVYDETLPGEVFGAHGPVHTRSQRLTLADRETDCIVQLQQWLEPATSGQPYQQANHAGFYRVALAVDDVAECYRQLLALGVDCPQPPVCMDMGPDVPIGGVWALFFYDIDGTCLELIQNPSLAEA
jgi:catechol 2,3-dioxygenase-like lactoylglutathione lyase family enzyme